MVVAALLALMESLGKLVTSHKRPVPAGLAAQASHGRKSRQNQRRARTGFHHGLQAKVRKVGYEEGMSDGYIEQHDDVYVVTGTRVSLDSIVYAFLSGQSAEAIAQAFPVMNLEQVFRRHYVIPGSSR